MSPLNRYVLGTIWVILMGWNGTVYGADYIYPKMDGNIANLEQTVRYLSEIKPARNYSNIGTLNDVANHIHDQFSAFGLQTHYQEFEVNGRVYRNVIGAVNVDKPDKIIVGAHYDVCGDQPGADDNASAVAGLLEIARLAPQVLKQSPFGFEFVAYTLEEPPFFATHDMGSYVHAKSLHDNNVSVKAMICLEMIGYFTDRKNSQQYPMPIMKLLYPSVGNFIGVIGNLGSWGLVNETARHMKKASIAVETLKAPTFVPGVDFSDHRNYWEFGYKAVMISDTAFYRNANYHEPGDTIDTLDFKRMAEVVKGVLWALLNMSK